MSKQEERSKSYKNQAHKLLQKEFPTLSVAAIGVTFAAHHHDFFDTYYCLKSIQAAADDEEALQRLQEQYNFLERVAQLRLKTPRVIPRFIVTDALLQAELERIPEFNKENQPRSVPDLTCGCCFGDFAYNVMVECSNGHSFCCDCLQQYIEEQFFGKNCIDVECMDSSGDRCPGFFLRHGGLDKLPAKLLESIDTRIALAEIKKAGCNDNERGHVAATAGVAEDNWVDPMTELPPLMMATTSDSNCASENTVAVAASSSNAELSCLPLEILAYISTDYFAYSDLMNLSATCRTFLHDVLPLVPRLFFTRPGELNDKQARRFEKGCVKEIKIFSYITYEQYEDEDENQKWCQKLCQKTARRIPWFVSRFSELKALFVGGVKRGRRLVMNGRHVLADSYAYEALDSCYDTVRHGRFPHELNKSNGRFASDGIVLSDDEIHRNLTRAFCGAFEMGILPNLNALHGIDGNMGCASVNRSCDGMCRLIFQTFPLSHIFLLAQGNMQISTQTCLSVKDRLAIIAKRPGGKEFLNHPDRLLSAVAWDSKSRDGEFYYHKETLAVMKELVDAYGCDPCQIPNEHLVKYLPPRGQPFRADSFHELKAIGFRIPDDYFANLV